MKWLKLATVPAALAAIFPLLDATKAYGSYAQGGALGVIGLVIVLVFCWEELFKR